MYLEQKWRYFTMNKLEDYLVSIPDFPKPGVVFRDITSILQDKDGLQLAIKEILKLLADIRLGHGLVFRYLAGFPLYVDLRLPIPDGKL